MTVSDIPDYIRAFFTLLGRYPLASLDSFVYVTQGNWDVNDVSHAHMYTNDLEGLTKEMSYGDAQQLCRVFMNIVTNAIKFTPENGKINVTAASDDKEKKILISVEDSGPGIEPEKRNRVFESFYKADPSRKQEGFGLGLYICKQILSGHDQTIYVDGSETLGGARFVFTFPYVPEDKK